MIEKVKAFLKIFLSYLVVVIMVGGTGYWLWNNPIYNPIGPKVQTPQSSIEVRFKDAVVRGRKNGIPYWTVYCKVVESERNSSIVYFRNKPTGEFYNLKDWSKKDVRKETPVSNTPPATPSTIPIPETNEKLRTFSWSAETAEYNTDTEDLTLKKKVKLVTDAKDKIDTEELHWSSLQEKATSDKRTKIVAGKGYPIVFADNLEADAKLDVLNLKGNVEITTELSEEQQL